MDCTLTVEAFTQATTGMMVSTPDAPAWAWLGLAHQANVVKMCENGRLKPQTNKQAEDEQLTFKRWSHAWCTAVLGVVFPHGGRLSSIPDCVMHLLVHTSIKRQSLDPWYPVSKDKAVDGLVDGIMDNWTTNFREENFSKDLVRTLLWNFFNRLDGNSSRQRQENRNTRRSAENCQRERDEAREALERDRDRVHAENARVHAENARREADDRAQAARRWEQERQDRLDARAEDLRRQDAHAGNMMMWFRQPSNDAQANGQIERMQREVDRIQQQVDRMQQQIYALQGQHQHPPQVATHQPAPAQYPGARK